MTMREVECAFHPGTLAVAIDPQSLEPVCQRCIDYRTCPQCGTIAEFGAWLNADDTLDCVTCSHRWSPDYEAWKQEHGEK